MASLVACSSSGDHPAASSGSSSGSSQATGSEAHASIGDLTITGGYIPQPASPSVAAAYLTISNSGSLADSLQRVTTSVTNSVMAMTESDKGAVGSMTDLKKVTIPAHGSFSFQPGHAHLMLQDPASRLVQNERVVMTLTFTRAGTVSLALPVVSLTGPSSSVPSVSTPSSSSSAKSHDMPGMPGMSMSS